MKILQVCNKITYPPTDGGSVAVLNISLPLSAAGHDVTILTLVTPKHNLDGDGKTLLEKHVKLRLVKENTAVKSGALLRNYFFSELPYTAERFISQAFRNELRKLLSEQHFDVIQMEGLYVLPYITTISEFSSALRVFRSHNAEHEIWESYSRLTINPLKRIYLSNLAARIRQMAGRYINTYDVLVPVSAHDLSFYESAGNKKPAFVCTCGFDNGFHDGSITSPVRSLFYIGSLDWLPNIHGILWFARKVFREIVRTSPEVIFHVAGRNAPRSFVRKLNHPNIQFHGEVKNAGEFIRPLGIAVVPLFSGSGIRVKILESMAFGKPVVATSKAAEGLDVTDGENILIADSPSEFIRQISRLSSDQAFYETIAANARALVQSGYDNINIAASLIEFYNKNVK
jgi:polysaccharide biosynthesis protein PslH